MVKKKNKCCYDCQFCGDKDTRFAYCGLTLYAGMFASMILTDPKETVKLPCPLENNTITLEAWQKYEEQLREMGYEYKSFI